VLGLAVPVFAVLAWLTERRRRRSSPGGLRAAGDA